MGCSTSQNTVSIVSPKNVSVDQIQGESMERTTSQSTRFLENCLIIWLCEETSNTFEKEKKQLRKLVDGSKTYRNIDSCIAFMTNIRDEKIFLIISGPHQSVERFGHLPQLERIYLLNCSPEDLNDQKHHTSKHIRLSDIDNLSQQLQEDMRLCEMDSNLLTIIPLSSREISFSSNLTKQEASFLFAQMIKEIVYRLKFESGSKDVFIDFCRLHYANDDEQLRVIDDFAKNYRPNKALRWLTNQSFISKIFNRVLRTREMDIFYKLGFFIRQVHIQLNHLYEENASLMKQISKVYRGKTMLLDEFDTLVKRNCGGLLCFSNFLITTTNKDVSIDFVRRRLVLHPDMTGVVFEIHINETIFNEKSPFAILKDVDMHREEICFHMGTVFRIESVEEITESTTVIWSVKLKPINENDEQLLRLVATARTDEMHANPISYLSKLLLDMGEHRRAEEVFLSLLQDTSARSQPRRLVRIHNGLGALYTYMNEHTKALDHFQLALQTSLIYLQPDHPDLALFYKQIGDSHLKHKDYNQAIQNYEKAIELLTCDTQQIHTGTITELFKLVNDAKQSIGNRN